jgi:nucleotide-binding universal stress UspA family protein
MSTINIVVGVGPSPESEAALRWALTKADHTGSAVIAVHVFDKSEHSYLPLERDKDDAVRHSHHRAQMLASTIAAEQGFPGPFSFHARSGDLETVLIEEASAGSVLVVGVPQRERHEDFLDRLAAGAQSAVVAVDEGGNSRVIGLPVPAAAAHGSDRSR